jgi:uncharacterized membrane protein
MATHVLSPRFRSVIHRNQSNKGTLTVVLNLRWHSFRAWVDRANGQVVFDVLMTKTAHVRSTAGPTRASSRPGGDGDAGGRGGRGGGGLGLDFGG